VLIHLQPYRESVRARVQYLLFGTENKPRNPDGVMVWGNAGTFVASSETISRKVKAFNYLISFKEDYKTLLNKVGDLDAFVEELLEWLIPYDKEDYEVLVVGHRDTDNFHFHITVLNRNLQTGKALYLPRTRSEIQFYQTLRKYFACKYGLELGQRRLVRRYVGDELGGKEVGKIKELLSNHLAELVKEGYLNSREDIVEHLKDLDFEVVDVWPTGVRVRREGYELTLIGGLFDEREFPEVQRELRAGARHSESQDFTPEEYRALSERVRELSAKRREAVAKRVRKEREQLQRSRRKRVLKVFRECTAGFCEGDERGHRGLSKSAQLLGVGVQGEDKGDRVGEGGQEFSSSLSSLSLRGSRRSDGSRWGLLDWRSLGEQRILWRKVLLPKLLDLSGRGGVGDREGVFLRSSQPPLDTPSTKEREVMSRRFPFTQEDIERVKRISPEVLLNYYGFPYERVGEQYLIKAPWRDETRPSVYLRVNPQNGHLIWKDFGGEQDGGSVIDFVMKASNLNFVEAVSLLHEIAGEPLPPEYPEEKFSSSFSRSSLGSRYRHRVLKAKDKVSQPALKSLLKSKGIDPNHLPPFVKELYWEVEREDGYKARFFGLGVQTVGGSWQVRTALSNRPKTVVEEEGTEHSFAYFKQNGRTLVVVEGLTDAISLWQYLDKKGVADKFDFVILGGTGNSERFLESGVWKYYNQVVLSLDFDEAGQKAEEKLLKGLVEKGYKGSVLTVVPAEGCKDINEFLSRKGESGLSFSVKVVSEKIVELYSKIAQEEGRQEVEVDKGEKALEEWIPLSEAVSTKISEEEKIEKEEDEEEGYDYDFGL